LLRKVAGRSAREALMAACTSRAAESILRLRSNCRLMRVEPLPLLDVISLTPAITPRRRSSGVATLLAMVGAGARQRGTDRDHREVDLRKWRHRQDEEGAYAGEGQAYG
jgi:hypothetical protein